MDWLYVLGMVSISWGLWFIEGRLREIADELRKLRQDDPERHRAF